MYKLSVRPCEVKEICFTLQQKDSLVHLLNILFSYLMF